MAHEHEHAVPESGKRLAIVIALNFIITITEVIGGLVSGSLSLLSDALHNFSDGIAVIIAWIAIRLRKLPRNDQYTFGLKRAEVLAAVINAGALVAISIYLFVEAWQHFIHPQPIAGITMTVVATVGLFANILGTWLLYQGAQSNMNLRAAYLHLFSDAISSIGVILGGLAIVFFHISWIDPLLTVLIGLYVLKESLHILWNTMAMFFLKAPAGIELAEVRKTLEQHQQISGIHHLHLWEVAEHDIHFEAHITVEDQPLSQVGEIRQQIEQLLKQQFAINHTTLQFEHANGQCKTANLN